MPKNLLNWSVVFALCASLFAAGACLRDSGKNKAPETPENPTPNPAGDELAEVISGHWINLNDPADRIELADTLMKQYTGAHLRRRCALEIRVNCDDPSCMNDDERLAGWCFVAQCQDDTVCYRVMRVTDDTLYLIDDPRAAQPKKYVRTVSPP